MRTAVLYVLLALSAAMGQGVNVVAAGDIACDPDMVGTSRSDLCQSHATAALIDELAPEAVLVLGDSQYETGSLEAFEEVFQNTWGVFRPKTYAAIGNHEYFSGGDGFFAYFGGRAGKPGEGYYSADLGSWHLLVLNSNCDIVSCSQGSAQHAWLLEDLAAHPSLCTLAIWHHPRYSSGLHGNNSDLGDLWQTLHEAGTELVLSGHDHHYERFAPQDAFSQEAEDGPRQFVVGTGGRGLRTSLIPRQNSESRISSAFGVLDLELAEDSYRWRFVSVTGDVLDEGSGACR